MSWPTAPVPSNFDQGIALYGYWATNITGTVRYRYPRGLDWFGLVPVPTGIVTGTVPVPTITNCVEMPVGYLYVLVNFLPVFTSTGKPTSYMNISTKLVRVPVPDQINTGRYR